MSYSTKLNKWRLYNKEKSSDSMLLLLLISAAVAVTESAVKLPTPEVDSSGEGSSRTTVIQKLEKLVKENKEAKEIDSDLKSEPTKLREQLIKLGYTPGLEGAEKKQEFAQLDKIIKKGQRLQLANQLGKRQRLRDGKKLRSGKKILGRLRGNKVKGGNKSQRVVIPGVEPLPAVVPSSVVVVEEYDDEYEDYYDEYEDYVEYEEYDVLLREVSPKHVVAGGKHRHDSQYHDHKPGHHKYHDQHKPSHHVHKQSHYAHQKDPHHHDQRYQNDPHHHDLGYQKDPHHHDQGYQKDPHHHDQGYQKDPHQHEHGYQKQPEYIPESEYHQKHQGYEYFVHVKTGTEPPPYDPYYQPDPYNSNHNDPYYKPDPYSKPDSYSLHQQDPYSKHNPYKHGKHHDPYVKHHDPYRPEKHHDPHYKTDPYRSEKHFDPYYKPDPYRPEKQYDPYYKPDPYSKFHLNPLEEPVYRENVDTLQSSSYPPHPSAYPPHSPTYPPSPPAYPPHPPTYPPHPPTYPSYSHSPSYPVQNKPIYPSYADHHRTGYSYNKQSEHVYHPTHPQPVLPPPPSSLHTPGPGEDIGGNTQGFTNIFATVPRDGELIHGLPAPEPAAGQHGDLSQPIVDGEAFGEDLVGGFHHHTGQFGTFGFYANFFDT